MHPLTTAATDEETPIDVERMLREGAWVANVRGSELPEASIGTPSLRTVGSIWLPPSQ